MYMYIIEDRLKIVTMSYGLPVVALLRPRLVTRLWLHAVTLVWSHAVTPVRLCPVTPVQSHAVTPTVLTQSVIHL